MSDDPDICPHDTCAAPIPDRLFACRRHWAELSDGLKMKIRRDWRQHDIEAMVENYALADAEWS